MQGWGAIPPPLPYIMAGTTATNANITPFNAMAVAPAVKTQVVIPPSLVATDVEKVVVAVEPFQESLETLVGESAIGAEISRLPRKGVTGVTLGCKGFAVWPGPWLTRTQGLWK